MIKIEKEFVGSNQVREIILSLGILESGHFVFADGDHGLVKLEMDNIWEYPNELDLLLAILAKAEGLPEAEVIMGVPSGGRRLADALHERWLDQIPVARIERVPNGGRRDYRFSSPEDEDLALSAKSVRIYEDVVTTLGSVAGVVKLLRPDIQEIRSLAIWRRGKVKQIYQVGVTDHYLVEEELPSFPPAECPVCLDQLQSCNKYS